MSDDNEITAGGTAVHRQAMVLRQSTRYLGAVGGSSGVRDLFIRIDRHCVSYYCIVVMCHVSFYLPVCVCVCVGGCACIQSLPFNSLHYLLPHNILYIIVDLIILCTLLFLYNSSCVCALSILTEW